MTVGILIYLVLPPSILIRLGEVSIFLSVKLCISSPGATREPQMIWFLPPVDSSRSCGTFCLQEVNDPLLTETTNINYSTIKAKTQEEYVDYLQ